MKAKVKAISCLLTCVALLCNAATAFASDDTAATVTQTVQVASESSSVVISTAQAADAKADPLAWEKEMLALVNAERAKHGVDPVELSGDLTKIAGKKAKEMMDLSYFSHTSPKYGKPSQFVKHYGYDKNVSENLHLGTSSTPKQVFKLWNESTTGHRENMLNPKWKCVGVGKAEKHDTTGTRLYSDNYHVQFFSE